MSELILPTDPVEIARPFATDLLIASAIEGVDDDQAIAEEIDSLHYVAALSGFMNKPFVVDSKTALLVPRTAQDFDEVDAQPLDRIVFEGRFSHYQPLYRRVGKQTAKALYLAFDNAMTVPFSSLLEGQRVVHVPVFDVAEISRAA